MTDQNEQIKKYIEKLILETDQHDRIEALVRSLVSLSYSELSWFQHFEREDKEG